jgi:hypothetical protein
MEWQRGSVTMWQHNALLTPYTCLAPAFAANIERIPVPQPTSSTTLPLNASLLMCETKSRVNSKLSCPSCVLCCVQSQHIACSPCARVPSVSARTQHHPNPPVVHDRCTVREGPNLVLEHLFVDAIMRVYTAPQRGLR